MLMDFDKRSIESFRKRFKPAVNENLFEIFDANLQKLPKIVTRENSLPFPTKNENKTIDNQALNNFDGFDFEKMTLNEIKRVLQQGKLCDQNVHKKLKLDLSLCLDLLS